MLQRIACALILALALGYGAQLLVQGAAFAVLKSRSYAMCDRLVC